LLNAQKFRAGISLNSNTSFFNKGSTPYDHYYYTAKSRTRFGLTVPVYFEVDKRWSLKSGIGLQVKEYRFMQDKFDFQTFRLKTYINKRFTTFEIPILGCFKTKLKNNYDIEFSTGVIMALNIPDMNKVGYSVTTFDTSHLFFDVMSPEGKWIKTFSPDLYGGISFVKNRDGLRRSQWIISYQYGLKPTEEFTLSSHISNSGILKEYSATIKPQLSSIIIGYTFFPRRWKF
jgi:hypothetical protein